MFFFCLYCGFWLVASWLVESHNGQSKSAIPTITGKSKEKPNKFNKKNLILIRMHKNSSNQFQLNEF